MTTEPNHHCEFEGVVGLFVSLYVTTEMRGRVEEQGFTHTTVYPRPTTR